MKCKMIINRVAEWQRYTSWMYAVLSKYLQCKELAQTTSRVFCVCVWGGG